MGRSTRPRAAVPDRKAGPDRKGVATYSESESNRAVLPFRGPDGEAATVIAMRRSTKVWVVLNGAVRTTVALTDPQAGQLIKAVRAASRGGDDPAESG